MYRFSEINEISHSRQSFYPDQVYNRTAILELANWVEAKDKNVLDLGCGDGGMLRIINERYPETKLSGLTVREDEKKAASVGDFDVRVGDAHNLPWDNEIFDLVIARHMLEHSIAPLLVLSEVNRVLKPGGKFIICVPGIESEWIVKWEDHFSMLPKLAWEKLFCDAGFEIEKNQNGVWLASYSMKEEIEYRFFLKKIKNVEINNRSNTTNLDIYNNNFIDYKSQTSGKPLKKIACIIHNITLFETIEPFLEVCPVDYDLYIPTFSDEQWHKMALDTKEYLIKRGYNPLLIDTVPDKTYEIVLMATPYTLVPKAKYYIRFLYGLAKETWNFDVWNINFDYILCYGPYDEEILSAYSKTVEIGPIKFSRLNKSEKGKKEKPYKLLYLPTYGEACSIEKIEDVLKELNQDFELTIRLHHGTTFLEPERVVLAGKLGKVSDHTIPLAELLNDADVVLSDGSGAIFDAIAANIPVVVFQPTPPELFEGKPSLEQEIILEQIVPNTNEAREIKKMLFMAIEDEDINNTRKKFMNQLFPIRGEECLKRLNNLVEDLLLNNNQNNNYILSHNRLRKEFNNLKADLLAKEISYNQAKNAWEEQKNQLLIDIGKSKEEKRVIEEDKENELNKMYSKMMEISDWAQSLKIKLEYIESFKTVKFLMKKNNLKNKIINTYKCVGMIGLFKKVLKKIIPLRIINLYSRLKNKNMIQRDIEKSIKKNCSKLIVAFPITAWNFRWQRSQHLLSRFAKDGNLVLMLAMDLQTIKGHSYNSIEEAEKDVVLIKLMDNVFELRYYTETPYNVYKDRLSESNLKNIYLSILSVLNKLKINEIMYIVQFPGWSNLALKLKAEKPGLVLYDCMDEHAGFSTNSLEIEETEKKLISEADVVITSAKLLEQKAKKFNDNTILIRNGTEFEHFNNPKANGKLDSIKDKPIIGYFGAISDWFDTEIIEYCAKEKPEWQFVLIGSTWGSDISKVEELDNVHIVGEVLYKDLPGYLSYFDVCIIPFKVIPLTMSTNPVKFYEYISAGKPIVSTKLPELEYYKDYCYLAETKEDFLIKLSKAVSEKEDIDMINKRIQLAKDNSWDARYEIIKNSIKAIND